MPEGSAWVRFAGDGLVVEGPCVVTALLWRCDKNDETCEIYDGLDAVSGKLFTELIGDAKMSYSFNLGDGVRFDNGVYVDQTTTNDVITVCFRNVE